MEKAKFDLLNQELNNICKQLKIVEDQIFEEKSCEISNKHCDSDIQFRANHIDNLFAIDKLIEVVRSSVGLGDDDQTEIIESITYMRACTSLTEVVINQLEELLEKVEEKDRKAA